jgi:Uma2 family endonuclease
LRVYPLVEQRVQVCSARFRVPDVSIVLGSRPSEQILTSPPLVAIEILSKDDRVSEMQERIDDYLKFGIRYVWFSFEGKLHLTRYTMATSRRGTGPLSFELPVHGHD